MGGKLGSNQQAMKFYPSSHQKMSSTGTTSNGSEASMHLHRIDVVYNGEVAARGQKDNCFSYVPFRCKDRLGHHIVPKSAYIHLERFRF